MNSTVYILIGVVLVIGGAWLIYSSMRRKVPQSILKVNEEAHTKKEHAKEAIIKWLEQNTTVTNDEVQGLVGVSDATATRYLDELIEEGKIEKSGSGRGVVYELKK